jgi:nucleoside-diphosphate-sugar epimerase
MGRSVGPTDWAPYQTGGDSKKRGPQVWRAWGRGDEGRACQVRPHSDYGRPIGRSSGASIRPAPRDGSLGARRSLLALENLLAAIEAVLAAPGSLRRAFIAADQQALTVAEMIAAMRHGLGRRPNIFPLPGALLQLLLRAAGREEIYQRLSGSLVADPSALMSLSWEPSLATPAGLAKLMQASGA